MKKILTSLVYGSARFVGAVTNNINQVFIGTFDVPTKLVDTAKNVALCLPLDITKWGLYPTHQDSWLSLAFVATCHGGKEDRLSDVRIKAFWEGIPSCQWPALIAKAAEFAAEFRTRLADGALEPRKAYKAATRCLQDCLLYREGEAGCMVSQEATLRSRPELAQLIMLANEGRAGKLTTEDGLALADKVDEEVAKAAARFGGIETCKQALNELTAWGKQQERGRVILMPEGITLEQGAQLVGFDAIIGQPDEHDIDVVSVVEDLEAPRLFQFRDALSQQRLDIIAVSENLGPNDQLTGGHPSFQSVAEMLLANGRILTRTGSELVERLASEVDPVALADKYLRVAEDFLSNAKNPKSWVARRNNPTVPQIKKAIPLYRVACDLIPRAFWMRTHREFTGGTDIQFFAEAAGLGAEYNIIRLMLDTQVAEQETMERVAEKLATLLQTEER